MRGYTLIELLVVLIIISIVGILVFVNFKTFSEDQVLKKAIGQVQTILRLAQSNATAGVKCGSNPSESWMVEFKTNKKDATLKCRSSSDSDTQVLTLEDGVEVDSISTGSACTGTPAFPNNSVTVVYTSVSGKLNFIVARGVSGSECNADTPTTTVTLKRQTSTKSLNVSKGGAVDVQ